MNTSPSICPDNETQEMRDLIASMRRGSRRKSTRRRSGVARAEMQKGRAPAFSSSAFRAWAV